MKKIIILSVAFVMLTGAAFAQPSVGAIVEGFVFLAREANLSQTSGTSQGQAANTIRFQASGANEDGTFTGYFRANGGDSLTPSVDQAFIWWRPIAQVGIFIGRQNDGIFETANIVAHNFSGGGYNGTTFEYYDYHGSAWGGAWKPGATGYALQIKPFDGLTLNVGVNHDGTVNLKDRYKDYSYGQIVFNNDSVGQIAFTYTTQRDFGGDTDDHIGFSFFNNSFIQDVAFEVGFGYNIELKIPAFGFGIAYMGDGWFFKTRGKAYFKTIIAEGAARPRFEMDFLHSYNVGDLFEMRMLVRLQFFERKDFTGDQLADNKAFAFAFNPYMIKRLPGGRINAGFIYLSRGHFWGWNGLQRNGQIRIPVGYSISM
jgi:hypothetical protein